MSKRIIGGRIWRAAHCAPIVFCLALGACSSAGEPGFLLLADPGKYQYHNCQQLDVARTRVVARQKDLKELIEKAEGGTAGVFVGAIAYRTDYVAGDQDLKTIDATAREKNCPLPSVPNRRSDTAIQ